MFAATRPSVTALFSQAAAKNFPFRRLAMFFKMDFGP
jgi:hypothetical protein